MITPILIGGGILLVILSARYFQPSAFSLQPSDASGPAGEPPAEPDASQQRPGGDSPTPPSIFPGELIAGSGRRASSVLGRTTNPIETDGASPTAAPSGEPSIEGKLLFLLNPNLIRRV